MRFHKFWYSYGNIFESLEKAILYIIILFLFYRYTTFIALYPIGVTGELLCLYSAQTYTQNNKLWSAELPNRYNFTFSYHYFLWITMLLYIPLFPQLYLHMFALRKKVLSKKVDGTKVKTKWFERLKYSILTFVSN